MKVLIAAAGLLSPVAALASPCTGPVCNFETLMPWVERLKDAHLPGTPPVHILQIGDSHTAGDAITGAWRVMLQDQFGGGGRGVLAPGRPYAGYVARGVTVTMSPGWRIASAFGKGSEEPRAMMGLSGFALASAVPAARIALTAEPGMAFDRFVLCAVAGMAARSVTVKTAWDSRAIDLTADRVEPRCITLRWGLPQSEAAVVADGGPVTITSWATFRDNGGVAVSNLGVAGSQLRHFARADDDAVAEELRVYAPDLIVLAFGTNEGFGPRIDMPAYESVLRGQIDRLRRLAPGVPILMLGPPDALSRNAALRGPGAVACGGGLFAPAGLDQVRRVQRKVAGDLDVAWWDWQDRMGGVCRAREWVERAPARMRGDYVHFNTIGGAAIAGQLHADLNDTLFSRF